MLHKMLLISIWVVVNVAFADYTATIYAVRGVQGGETPLDKIGHVAISLNEGCSAFGFAPTEPPNRISQLLRPRPGSLTDDSDFFERAAGDERVIWAYSIALSEAEVRKLKADALKKDLDIN